MRKQVCLILAVLVSSAAYGQYRLAGGEPVPLREFERFGRSEVIAVTARGLVCSTFTDVDVETRDRLPSSGGLLIPIPASGTQRIYGKSFLLTNYPVARP